MKVTNFLVQHNIPLSVSDHLSPVIREIFDDSEISRGYSCARTKSTCILNGSLAPYFKAHLVNVMTSGPYSIAVDGSNDNDLQKMYPLTVRFYDEKLGKVTTQLLDMCLTSGKFG